MRKPRQFRDGALHHVTARANRKEKVLEYKGMKDLFLQVVARNRSLFGSSAVASLRRVL